MSAENRPAVYWRNTHLRPIYNGTSVVFGPRRQNIEATKQALSEFEKNGGEIARQIEKETKEYWTEQLQPKPRELQAAAD